MGRWLYLLFLINFNVSAGVFKCQGDDGKIKYQDNPCMAVTDARPLEIEELPPDVLYRMQKEELRVDARMEGYKQKKRRWALLDYQRRQKQMQMYAVNQSIAESTQLWEEQVKEERRAGSRRYYVCRGPRSSISKCNRFD